MAYACPRCGKEVRRGGDRTAQAAAGLVGLMIYAAFGAFQCADCGKIKRDEFPPEIQSKMLRNSALLVVGGVGLFVAVIALLIALNS